MEGFVGNKCGLCGNTMLNEFEKDTCELCSVAMLEEYNKRTGKSTYQVMKCGHVSNSTVDGKPHCVICNVSAQSSISLDELKQRDALCIYCAKKVKSNHKLPFFKYEPYREHDLYYCLCRGSN
jgi:hypothetical protein